MARVSLIREGLAARMATISGLNAYARAKGELRLPAAVVVPEPGAAIAYNATMGRGSDDHTFRIYLLVEQNVEDLDQRALDDYLDGSGSKSIIAAIDGDGSLGGAAHFTRVVGVADYGEITWAGVQYLGAEILVEVTAGGTS